MKHFYVWTLTILATLLSCSSNLELNDNFKKGMNYYRFYQMENAYNYFKKAQREITLNNEGQLLLAETALRTDKSDEAYEITKKVLRADSCNSHAHTVLSDIFAPTPYSLCQKKRNIDSSLSHALKATKFDEKNRHAWKLVYLQALLKNDTLLTKKALQSLYKNNIYSQVNLEYERWGLRCVPDSSILITTTNESACLYLALQQNETIRTDVVILAFEELYSKEYRDAFLNRLSIHIKWASDLKPPQQGLYTVIRKNMQLDSINRAAKIDSIKATHPNHNYYFFGLPYIPPSHSVNIDSMISCGADSLITYMMTNFKEVGLLNHPIVFDWVFMHSCLSKKIWERVDRGAYWYYNYGIPPFLRSCPFSQSH